MKKWISILLLVILLTQALPLDALASVGKVLTKEELDRAYALTGLGADDGQYHNGMKANAGMSGMQLARWLEERLDTQLHNIDDVLSRARFQLHTLNEKYPTLYKTFVDSPYYSQIQALSIQVEELRLELTYQLERVKTDINMISQMRELLLDDDGTSFDSQRVRLSARIEEAEAELVDIRDHVLQNADDWDAKLAEWTKSVQAGPGGEAEDAITASLRDFMRALWKKYNLGEGSDEAVEAELRALLKKRYARYMPEGVSIDAFADDAVELMRDFMQKYDPDGGTGAAILTEVQTLLKRLYEKLGQDGADDEALIAGVTALMQELWQKFGPDSEINKAFFAAWKDLMIKYGIDTANMDALLSELRTLAEALWQKYGTEGEARDALIARIKALWSSIGTTVGEKGVGQWLSLLFTAESKPVSNVAPVVAVSPSNSRASRLSAAAGIKSNDADATVTVITKNEVCLSFVIGSNQTRKGVDGVSVMLRDATKPDAPLSQYTSKNGGLVILPTNLFVADKYDEVHLYVEVDPRQQGYRDYVIEDLELKLGGTFMDALVPLEGAATNGGSASNAAEKPYIVSASFNGKDIMHSEYEMIYSPANGKKFSIKAVVANPSGEELPDLMMSWYENEGGFSRIKKHWAEATSKRTIANGYTEYTFRDTWKRKFTPNASDEQRPTFSFGNESGALSYPSQLVSLRSATDEPLNEGTGAEGGVYANVLGKGFSMGFTIPVIGVGVGLDLPFTKYWPRLSINPAGFVAMWVGCPMMEKELEDSALNWESNDMKKFRQASEWVEREGWFANYKAQYSLAADYYRTKTWKFMGQSSIEVGMFAVGTGRWELDNNNPDVKSKNVQVALGFGMTACYEYSWTISYPIGPVPVYICFSLGVCAGVSIQFTADFCWASGGFANFKIYPIDEITYSISFYFAAQLGIGIKGFLEAYVRFVASFDIMIRMVLFGLDKCSTQVSAGFDLSTGVTVFFVKFKKSWISKEKIIWSTVPADNSLLGHYMNEDKNDEKVVEAAHLDPQSYPELAPESKAIIRLRDAKPSFKVVHAGNTDFVFFITVTTDKNGKEHRRVNWVNAKATEKKGSVQEAIDTWQTSLNGYDDYAVDAYESDGLVFLSVACAANFNDDGLPLPNEDFENGKRCNQIFYLLILKPDGNGSLTHKLDKGYYTRTDKEEDHFLVTANPVGSYVVDAGTPNQRTLYYYYDSIATPEITWAKATRRSNKVTGIELFGTFGRVSYKEDEPSHGVTSYEMITDKAIKCFNDKYVVSGMGKGYVRTGVRGAMRCSDTEPKLYHRSGNNELNSPSFVALSRPLNGNGDTAIEVFDFEMNAVDDMLGREAVVVAQGDIQHFELAQTAVNGDGANYRRVIFYTEKETGDDGAEQWRLYGLYLEPVVRGEKNITFTVTKYAYDLVIPDGQFSLAYMGETPYIYWIAAVPNPKNEEDIMYRVWTVAYDMSTNAMTDASVFTEFTLPSYTTFITGRVMTMIDVKDTMLYDLKLMGTGTSYFSIVPNEIPKYSSSFPSPVSIHSIPELLKPVTNLTAAITQAPAVAAGNFEDISLALMNSGNMGVAAFDVALYEVNDGQEGKNPIETVHVNCVDPEKSKITMQGGKVELTGKKVAHRAEDFDYTARQRDWVLSQEKKEYKVMVFGTYTYLDSVRTLESDTQYVKSDVLMPGSVGVYNTAFKIPESWRGQKKLRFKITELSVHSNLARISANAAGAEVSDLLTYALDELTGKLVLQKPDEANGLAANAVKSGLFANSIDSSTLDLELTVHDLSVSHRVYKGWDGQKWLDIIVHNYAAFGDNPKLSCAVYVDGASDPYYVNLPYYEQATGNRMTQTISMPVSALVDDPAAHGRARVEVTVVGREDSVHTNNEFTVYLGGTDALRFITEPVDTAVQEGEDVSLAVEVTGGTKPYGYQWQMWDEKHQKWVDLPGFTEATLSREKIEKKWDGCRFRCVVTDAAGTKIISRAVTLTVRDKVPTGDRTSLPLYLSVALIALALLWFVRRRARRVG